jgi:hypothetical protein
LTQPPTNNVTYFDNTDIARRINHLIKALIVILFAIALFIPISYLEGKAMGMRVPLFVGSALVIPVFERFRKIGRTPYPHVADTLLVLPFVVDTFGNVAGLYENFAVTDDILHCINWVFLVCAFQAFRYRRSSQNPDAILLGAGFGALAIVIWEIMEWAVDTTGAGGGLGLTYGDTIGDLTLSTSGGIIGSLIGVYWLGALKGVAGN